PDAAAPIVVAPDAGEPIEIDCDFDALTKAGENSVALGQHAEALKHYEEAHACRPDDPHTVQLAFMEACNANLLAKAQLYWKKLSTDVQNRALQICVRNHITREQLDGDVELEAMHAALRDRDLAKARKHLDAIDDAAHKKEATRDFDAAEQDFVDDVK